MKQFLRFCISLLFFWLVARADTVVSLSDINGREHEPLAVSDHQAVVLAFVSPFCPTSNAFVPEVNRIAVEYGGQFAFYLVEADATLSLADAKKHADAFEIKRQSSLTPNRSWRV